MSGRVTDLDCGFPGTRGLGWAAAAAMSKTMKFLDVERIVV